MIHRANHPVEPWAFVEEGVDLDRLAQTESLFALSNGHIGLRGNLDEGEPRGLSGTYLNGFYESFPLEYGERGYGFAEDGQSGRQRHRRQDHPAAGRGRAARRAPRRGRAPHAAARLPQRPARARADLAGGLRPHREGDDQAARLASPCAAWSRSSTRSRRSTSRSGSRSSPTCRRTPPRSPPPTIRAAARRSATRCTRGCIPPTACASCSATRPSARACRWRRAWTTSSSTTAR